MGTFAQQVMNRKYSNGEIVAVCASHQLGVVQAIAPNGKYVLRMVDSPATELFDSDRLERVTEAQIAKRYTRLVFIGDPIYDDEEQYWVVPIYDQAVREVVSAGGCLGFESGSTADEAEENARRAAETLGWRLL